MNLLPLTTKRAVAKLQKELKKDKNYYNTYHANIKLCVFDELNVPSLIKHRISQRKKMDIADKAANRFLKLFLEK